MRQDKKAAGDTRSTLLTHAANEFYRYGYAGASLDRLARAAGVTKGGLFHYFPTKKALLSAVIAERIGTYIERTWCQFFESEDDPRVAFLQISRHYREHWLKIYQPSLGCPFYNLLHEMGGTDLEVQRLLHDIYDRWLKAVENCFRRGSKKHLIRPAIDAKVTALNLVSIYYGFVSQAKLTGSVDIYFQGLDYLESFVHDLSRTPKGVAG